jgi:hypothetical protein
MRSPLWHRVLSLTIALATGLAGSSLALAHGFAHAREAHAVEHRAESRLHVHDGAVSALVDETTPHVDGPEHPHPVIEMALTARVDAFVSVAVLVVLAAWTDPPVNVVALVPAVGDLPNTHPPGAPPPRLRGPPLS